MLLSKILKLEGLVINSVVFGKKGELVLAPRGKMSSTCFLNRVSFFVVVAFCSVTSN